MVKKVFKAILKTIIIVVIYLLQCYVINNTMFFGVNGDMCLMLVVVTALMRKDMIVYITAAICGITSDILFSNIPCKYLVIYIIVAVILCALKKMYKQESKLSIIVFSMVAVLISEVLMYLFNLMFTGELTNVFALVIMMFKQCIINIFLSFVIYLVFKIIDKEG